MPVTEIVQPSREPPHPAVIARRVGKGQGLTHFAVIAYATGPMMALHHARVHDLVAEEGYDRLQTGFAMHCASLHSLDLAALVDFVPLSIGPALGPAHHRTPRPT